MTRNWLCLLGILLPAGLATAGQRWPGDGQRLGTSLWAAESGANAIAALAFK